MNSTFHESLSDIPMVVHHNRRPERAWTEIVSFLPNDREPTVQERINSARESLMDAAEKRHKRIRNKRYRPPMRVGEMILVKKPTKADVAKKQFTKFSYVFHGPYKIARSFGNNCYEVVSLNGREMIGRFNAKNLKRYVQKIV